MSKSAVCDDDLFEVDTSGDVILAEAVDDGLAQLSASVKQEFHALAERMARGASPKDGEVQAVCTAAGRSIDVFRAVVDRLRKRIEALAKLAEAAKYDAEQSKAAEKVTPLGNELKAMQERHRTEFAELSKRIEENRRQYMGAQSLAYDCRNAANRTLRVTAANVEGDVTDLLNVKID